jgi:hypothetical protein
LVACGSDDSSSSSSTTTDAGGQVQSESREGPSAKGGDEQGGSGTEGDDGKSADSAANSASDFVPKQHSDSGGGSEQFKVKGGDNSVQEFGGEAETSEFNAASAVLHNFLDARAEGNWAAACEYISQDIVKSLEKLAAQAKGIEDKSCAGVLEKLTNPDARQSMKDEAAQADVRSLRLEGDQAFALYTDSDGSVFSMPMDNEDGTWKVGSLAGYPLS